MLASPLKALMCMGQAKYRSLKFFSLHSKPIGYLDLKVKSWNSTNVLEGLNYWQLANQEEREGEFLTSYFF